MKTIWRPCGRQCGDSMEAMIGHDSLPGMSSSASASWTFQGCLPLCFMNPGTCDQSHTKPSSNNVNNGSNHIQESADLRAKSHDVQSCKSHACSTPDMLNILMQFLEDMFCEDGWTNSVTLQVDASRTMWRDLWGLDVCSDTNPNTAHLHVQRSCAVDLEKSHSMLCSETKRVQGSIFYHLVQCYWGQEPYSEQDTDSSHLSPSLHGRQHR